MHNKKKIGIVTTPISKSGLTPLSNFIKIMYSISNSIFLITGDAGYDFFKKNNKIKTYNVSHTQSSFFLFRIIKYIIMQINISLRIFIDFRIIDPIIFFIGGDTLLLPTITSWILRKKIVLLIAGSSIQTLKAKNDPLFMGLNACRFLTCLLSTKIVIYSELLIKEYHLEKWKKKIHVAHEHFIDFNTFKANTRYFDRFFDIGFVGRLSEEKGIINFIEALTNVLEKKRNLQVIIVGDGLLLNEVIISIEKRNLNNQIFISGFIDHKHIPKYLNQIKLLVVPSYTEGLPNIIIEAMACGTPVLATPVGSIPDIVKDGVTGFIMENNSPKSIEMNLYRVLDYPNIEEIIKNSKYYAVKKFKFESTLNNWQNIFTDLV